MGVAKQQGEQRPKDVVGILEQEGKPLPFSAIRAQIGFLAGDILTVVDASVADPRQNKAMKDLVKQQVRARLNWISELCEINGRDITDDNGIQDKPLGLETVDGR